MVVLIIAILVLCLALIAQNIPYTVLWWAKEHSRELRKSRAQRSILRQRISEQKEEIRILQKRNNTLRRSLKHKAHMTPKHVATARRIIQKPWYKSWRIRQLKREFRRWDRILLKDLTPSVGTCVRNMERIARKQEWYNAK